MYHYGIAPPVTDKGSNVHEMLFPQCDIIESVLAGAVLIHLIIVVQISKLDSGKHGNDLQCDPIELCIFLLLRCLFLPAPAKSERHSADDHDDRHADDQRHFAA